MFTALQLLLAQVVSLAISMVANEDGTITVVVMPKARKDGEAFASLNTPLTLTGTPAELDAEFTNILASYTNKHNSLAEQLEATEAVLEAAKKASVKKATTKSATKNKPDTPKPAEKSGDDAHGGDDGAGNAGEESQPVDNLWG